MVQPIFVTGIPRSGTTWVGRTFAASKKIELVNEPFNWKKHPERAKYHMKYLPAGSNDPQLVSLLQELVKPRHQGFLQWLTDMSHVVVKDVHTCLAAEYIWETIQPRVVVLVRHPCAVADSWARLGYEITSRLDILLNQESLLRDYLDPFVVHLQRKKDYFFEIGAYWGATYFVLSCFSEKHPDWCWVTHESLCISPVEKFERLFKDLGLDMRTEVRDFLVNNNRKRNSHEGPYSVARVSQREPDKWQMAMSSEQISSVLEGVEPFGVLNKLYQAPVALS